MASYDGDTSCLAAHTLLWGGRMIVKYGEVCIVTMNREELSEIW